VGTEHFAACPCGDNSSFIRPSCRVRPGLGVRFEVAAGTGRASNPSLVPAALASLFTEGRTELISGMVTGGGGIGAVIDQAAVGQGCLSTATRAPGQRRCGRAIIFRTNRPRPRGWATRSPLASTRMASSTADEAGAGFAPPRWPGCRSFADRQPGRWATRHRVDLQAPPRAPCWPCPPTVWRTGEPRLTCGAIRGGSGVSDLAASDQGRRAGESWR